MEGNTSRRAKALPPYTELVRSHNDLKRRYGTLENTWKTTVTRIRSIHNDHALPLEEKYTLIVQLFTKTDDDVPLIFSILGEMEL